ncbi:hypothetical protein C5S53_08365 [Methanophagales archaeon]|nr:hypothetical protein C5S53_08365 [Methanophagales archaeon]
MGSKKQVLRCSYMSQIDKKMTYIENNLCIHHQEVSPVMGDKAKK